MLGCLLSPHEAIAGTIARRLGYSLTLRLIGSPGVHVSNVSPTLGALREQWFVLAVSSAFGLSLIALLAAGDWPISREMARHIILMNIAAPLLAMALPVHRRRSRTAGRHLAVATIVQLSVLFAAHTPAGVAAAHTNALLHLLKQVGLFAAALAFWITVLDQVGAARWRAVLALLITGKLFCLLGAVLVFAPRSIYPGAWGHAASHAVSPLDDQHLSGVLMLAACPATYVLAGVVIAARWVCELPGAER